MNIPKEEDVNVLLLQLTECSPVETWESSIILYARSERNEIADEMRGTENRQHKRDSLN